MKKSAIAVSIIAKMYKSNNGDADMATCISRKCKLFEFIKISAICLLEIGN